MPCHFTWKQRLIRENDIYNIFLQWGDKAKFKLNLSWLKLIFFTTDRNLKESCYEKICSSIFFGGSELKWEAEEKHLYEGTAVALKHLYDGFEALTP